MLENVYVTFHSDVQLGELKTRIVACGCELFHQCFHIILIGALYRSRQGHVSSIRFFMFSFLNVLQVLSIYRNGTVGFICFDMHLCRNGQGVRVLLAINVR